ncbi:MAG: diaminohydroxyphosphoribosylaminopyrimidine deaminase [Segetibacter sp.]|nr:diaminohydroxyphosphoribosylaminopyrimidine deaminase [Segetibacter sp.]
MNVRLPSTLQVFDGNQKTIIFNGIKNEELQNVVYYQFEKEPSFVQALLKACYKLNIQSVLIEGGSRLAESFINENAWDEARVIENPRLIIHNGLRAPLLSNHQLVSSEAISSDVISYYKNLNNKL